LLWKSHKLIFFWYFIPTLTQKCNLFFQKKYKMVILLPNDNSDRLPEKRYEAQEKISSY